MATFHISSSSSMGEVIEDMSEVIEDISISSNSNTSDEVMILEDKNAYGKIDITDFHLVSTLGKGGFGKVFLAKLNPESRVSGRSLRIQPGHFYAIKSVRKSRLLANRTELKHTQLEQRVLEATRDHPFVVKLICTFQSRGRIFFLTEFLPGGELFRLLSIKEKLSESDSRFYLSEMVLALEFLHKMGIVYRDLKPENVMINYDGHLKLIDFGLARDQVSDDSPRKMTYCGTREYMAPEVYRREHYSITADWWSLGAMAYDMLTGKFPYSHGDYDSPIDYFTDFHSFDAIKLVSGLLTVNAKKRLGSSEVGGPHSIKKSDFFKSVNWNDVYRKRVRPPFMPRLEPGNEVKYFDEEFVKIPARMSIVQNVDAKNLFQEFDYVHPDHTISESPPPSR